MTTLTKNNISSSSASSAEYNDMNDNNSNSNENDNGVKVYLRFRPMNDLELSAQSPDCADIHGDHVTFTAPDDSKFTFQFDGIFHEDTSTEYVSEKIGFPLVHDFLSVGEKARNCCVFTYGEKGTGKTYTMLGSGHRLGDGDDDVSSLSSCGVSEVRIRYKPYANKSRKNKPSPLLNLPPSLTRLSGNSLPTPHQRMMESSRRRSNEQEGYMLDGVPYDFNNNNNNDIHHEHHGGEAGSGLISNIVYQIFETLADFPRSAEVLLKFSMYEVHLEEIRDLLVINTSHFHRDSASSRSDEIDYRVITDPKDGSVYVEGITQIGVTTPTHVMGLLDRGIENRTNNTAARMDSGT